VFDQPQRRAETAYAWSAYTMGMGAGLHYWRSRARVRGSPTPSRPSRKEQSHTYSVSYSAVLMVLARWPGAWSSIRSPRFYRGSGRRQ